MGLNYMSVRECVCVCVCEWDREADRSCVCAHVHVFTFMQSVSVFPTLLRRVYCGNTVEDKSAPSPTFSSCTDLWYSVSSTSLWFWLADFSLLSLQTWSKCAACSHSSDQPQRQGWWMTNLSVRLSQTARLGPARPGSLQHAAHLCLHVSLIPSVTAPLCLFLKLFLSPSAPHYIHQWCECEATSLTAASNQTPADTSHYSKHGYVNTKESPKEESKFSHRHLQLRALDWRNRSRQHCRRWFWLILFPGSWPFAPWRNASFPFPWICANIINTRVV